MTATLSITTRRPISNTHTISIKKELSVNGGRYQQVVISDLLGKNNNDLNGNDQTARRLISGVFSFLKDVVKMVVSNAMGNKSGSISGHDKTDNSRSDTDVPDGNRWRNGGNKTSDGLLRQDQNWKLPPTIYGNTANLGIYVDHSLLRDLQTALKEPIVKKLFETAKKKGLVSITEEPSLQYEAIPVSADEVRDPDAKESRIRIANAGDPEVISLLVHELVHAATPENMNSMVEEYYAENIGRAIYRRITGHTNLSMKPFSEIKKDYANLPGDNHIKQDLRNILNDL